MGKSTGFLEYERCTPQKRPPKERIKDWDELKQNFDEEMLVQQSARCMDCGIPFCHSGMILKGMTTGCPLNNLIPEWNDLVYKGLWEDAYKRLSRTSPFPEFTSRVCPAPCEGACTEGYIMESVAINSIEYAIIEKAFKKGWVKAKTPNIRTNKRVAIVGSGPSGLSCAYYLNRVGHTVTVYERSDRVGGLLMYGIPNMKLDKQVVNRRVELMKSEGVEFITNTEVGKDYPTKKLLEEYDAVVLCGGATNPRDLSVKGRELKGIYFAVDFLKKNTKSLLDSNHSDNEYISAKDKNVIVIGGGDTGTDCVGTSIRHSCKNVVQFEILPEPPKERQDKNPWPEWPKKLKVDYGQEEAKYLYGDDPRQYCIMTKEIIGNTKGELTEVHTVNVKWEKDISGRFIPKEIPGSNKIWKADLVLLAMGFLGPEDDMLQQLEIERDQRSNVKTQYDNFKTNIDNVFSAGDMRRGQSLVVWAIREGQSTAREVDKFLMGKSNIK